MQCLAHGVEHLVDLGLEMISGGENARISPV
jgi:hypothetical protein